MAGVTWSLKGKHIKNCNCAWGCPCDFNAPPTQGPCEGMAAMDIEEGYFNDVRLDGLRWAAVYRWPGPLHEGNGTIQAIIDERADDAQRGALLTIMSGQEQVEGTWFQIMSAIVTNFLKPRFLPIEFTCDLDKRTARVFVPGVLETTSETITNPVTGAPHRICVVIPDGMEYEVVEVANAAVNKGLGEIKYDVPGGHSSLAEVEYTPAGLVHRLASRLLQRA